VEAGLRAPNPAQPTLQRFPGPFCVRPRLSSDLAILPLTGGAGDLRRVDPENLLFPGWVASGRAEADPLGGASSSRVWDIGLGEEHTHVAGPPACG
jgi:hypothetical protein